MSEVLTAFRISVYGPHIKVPWAIRLHQTLSFVDNNPQFIPEIGLMSTGSNSFLINSKVCSTFFGMKRNSLNRNLQQHGFILDRKADVMAELLPDHSELEWSARHWSKRIFILGSFNPESTIEEINLATNNARLTRTRNQSRLLQDFKEEVSDRIDDLFMQNEDENQFDEQNVEWDDDFSWI
jgi:hypothetical protein